MMTRFTPVLPTQPVYRVLLQAMAHPCRPTPLDVKAWPSLLLAVAETLLDHEVSFCLHPDAPPEWEEAIFTRTKSAKTAITNADYLIVKGPCPKEDLAALKRGTPLFPDQGATVIQVVDKAYPDPGPIIEGPGLKTAAPPVCNPLTPEEWGAYRNLNEEYPLGIDLLSLIGNDTVCALPRSTRIQM